MNKFLLKQIIAKWQSNIWIVIELLLVSVIFWYIVDSLYVINKYESMPMGYNTDHCYLITPGIISNKSPLMTNIPEDERNFGKGLQSLLIKMKHRPEVEAACVVYSSMYPYGVGHSYTQTAYIDENDSISWCNSVYYQQTTSQYPIVFSIHGANGETPEELADILKKDNYLFSTNAFSRDDVKPEQFINKRVLLDGNQGMLGAVIPPRRDHAYDMPSEYAIYNAKITGWYGQIAIRVKPQFDNNIVESLFNDIKNLQSGSVIISDIQSFADIKRNYEMDHELENRNFVVIAVFLLINIFLGVFGTFWFRTRQNIKEIALRKVTGASDKQIFFRIISEAIILLVIATIPSIGIDIYIAHNELTKTFFEYIGWERTGGCITATFLLLAFITIVGVAIPASNAMKAKPAIVLKEE